MKSSSIFLFALLTCAVKSEISRHERTFVVQAIHGIIVNSFVNKTSTIHLVYRGEEGGVAAAIINELVHKLAGVMTIRVSLLVRLPLIEHCESPGVFIFDTNEDFDKFFFNGVDEEFISESGFWYNQVIYVPDLQTEDIDKLILGSPSANEVSFITNSATSSIELVTNFLYTDEKCNEIQITTINQFSRTTRRWANENFFPDKFSSFHICSLEVLTFSGASNEIGRKIFKTLAETFNFTIVEKPVDAENFMTVNINLELCNYISMQNNYSKNAILTSAIFFDHVTLVIPPGEPLTDLQRMFAAFDEKTWIGIGVTFAIAVVVIQIINKTTDTIKNFIFGRNIRTPLLNLLDIFFNGGQNREPGRNFSRFFLMLFILWSLIFRTCYQSKMFENLNNDMRRRRVETMYRNLRTK